MMSAVEYRALLALRADAEGDACVILRKMQIASAGGYDKSPGFSVHTAPVAVAA